MQTEPKPNASNCFLRHVINKQHFAEFLPSEGSLGGGGGGFFVVLLHFWDLLGQGHGTACPGTTSEVQSPMDLCLREAFCV